MSRIDDLVTEIATEFNDATVEFVGGSVQRGRHSQQRRIIFARMRGQLRFISAPGARPETTPVANQGTLTQQRFERLETLKITLRAEDETELDTLFDRFVNVVFELYGPNAFEEANNYQWYNEDSKSSGTYSTRNPSIDLLLPFSFASRSDPKPYFELVSTTADLGIPDETKPDAPTVVNP